MLRGAWILVLLAACSSSSAEPASAFDERELLPRLRALPHVTAVTEYLDAPDANPKAVPAGYRRFDITFDQPEDHDHPEAAHFSQRVMLLHKSVTAPMVLASSGYHLRDKRGEVATTFATNQLNVEHRYFGPSTPNDPAYVHLDARQAAIDFHEITVAFKGLYQTPWIGSGASKGGETAIFHRYFFPEDTEATVAYVAPLLLSDKDDRFPPFLRTVGGERYAACREKLVEFQKTVLRRREEIKPLIRGTYDRIGGLDVAIEHGTFEFYFGFWQYGDPADPVHGCPGIPATDAPPAVLADFLEYTGSLYTNIDDQSLADFAAFYVQSARELGSYGSDESELASLVTHQDTYVIQTYVPKGVPATYDGKLLRDVAAFVESRAERMILVYGEYDPWTSAAANVSSARDAYRFVAPAGNHGSVMGSLAPADRAFALGAVARWANVAVPANAEPTAVVRPRRWQ